GFKQRSDPGKDFAMKNWKYSSAVVLIGLALVSGANAQKENYDTGPELNGPQQVPTPDFLNVRGTDRPSPLKEVTIEQRLNSQLPLDTPFKDEYGNAVKLGDYFGKRP